MGATGSLVFQTLDAGFTCARFTGSIIAILAMTPMGSYLPVILGVLAATAVSFASIRSHFKSRCERRK